MNDYEKRLHERNQNEQVANFITEIYLGSGKNQELLQDLLNKLVEVKDRITYQNIILYYWQYIQDEKRLDINSYSEMTCEKEWKDYRGKTIFKLQDFGIENCWGEEDPEYISENEVKISNLFILHAVEYFMAELIKSDVLKRGKNIFGVENLVTHLSSELISLNVRSCVNSDGSIDEVAVAELMLCLKMALTEPDMYYIGGWREGFFKQHFLHDLEWAKKLAKNNYCDEDDE